VATVVVVTREGDAIIAARMIGATPSQAEPKYLGWGTGGIAGGPFTAAKTDVGAFQEAAENRVTCTTSQVTTTWANDTYQAVGTITSLSAQTIAEVLLGDTSAKPAAGAVAAGGVVGSSSATTLNTAATFSPGNNGYVQIRTEVMQVTAGSGTTALTVVRGANGSAAISTIAAADIVTGGNAPGSSVVSNGDLFVHASFSGLPLSIGDSLQSTIQVSFN
jgi:hypothetical protein